jgi:hypothetical protein
MDIESKTAGDPAGGVTPLALACLQNSHSVISWLVEAGADDKAMVQEYGTLLCFVVCCHATAKFKTKTLATIRILLEHGANPNATNSGGQTPLFPCSLMNIVVRCCVLCRTACMCTDR